MSKEGAKSTIIDYINSTLGETPTLFSEIRKWQGGKVVREGKKVFIGHQGHRDEVQTEEDDVVIICSQIDQGNQGLDTPKPPLDPYIRVATKTK